MPSKEQIIEFIQASDKPAGKREIAKAFGVKGQEKIALKKRLKDMAEEGLIDGRKTAFQTPTREVAGQTIPDVLADMQSALLTEAAERRDANITRGVTEFAAVEEHFAASRYPGWVEVQWSKPTGAALEKVVEQLKEHKLTIRNVPMDALPVDGACIFTGEPATERVLLAKAY